MFLALSFILVLLFLILLVPPFATLAQTLALKGKDLPARTRSLETVLIEASTLRACLLPAPPDSLETLLRDLHFLICRRRRLFAECDFQSIKNDIPIKPVCLSTNPYERIAERKPKVLFRNNRSGR